MSTMVLLQTTDNWERLNALQERFVRGGSWVGALLALVGLAVAIGLLVLLYLLQQKRRRGDVDNPGKLYRGLLAGLELSVPQRDFLWHLARDLQLEHPTVLLLGRGIYHTHTQRWLAIHNRPENVRQIEELAVKLFPGDHIE